MFRRSSDSEDSGDYSFSTKIYVLSCFFMLLSYSTFGLLIVYHDVALLVVLLLHFIFVEAIHVCKTDLINERYRIDLCVWGRLK